MTEPVDFRRRIRGFWWSRQGLDGSLCERGPADVLSAVGWARSVGGSNPYLTLFVRARLDRSTVDDAVAACEIHELPSARGCAYVLPRNDFALGLRVGEASVRPSLRLLERLGVPRAEIDSLAADVLSTVDEPRTPEQLRASLGDKVRSLGLEGRKRGASTTLPTVLGLLQSTGAIRRVPLHGRLDEQRYAYVRWESPTLTGDPEISLVRKYFQWIGAATVGHVRWFTGFTAAVVRRALRELDAVDVRAGMFALPEDVEPLRAYRPPKKPCYRLVHALDGFLLLHRDIRPLVDSADADRPVPVQERRLGELVDLADHPIIDRGRIVGMWQFDADEGEIVWQSFVDVDDDLLAEIDRTQTFIRDQLGDHRWNSLDSQRSRLPRISAVRAQEY